MARKLEQAQNGVQRGFLHLSAVKCNNNFCIILAPKGNRIGNAGYLFFTIVLDIYSFGLIMDGEIL